MFYSTITPNILFDLLTAAGWAALGVLAVLVAVGLFIAVILNMGLLALSRSQYPAAETISLEELESMFTANEPTEEQRARAYHPAGRSITHQ